MEIGLLAAATFLTAFVFINFPAYRKAGDGTLHVMLGMVFVLVVMALARSLDPHLEGWLARDATPDPISSSISEPAPWAGKSITARYQRLAGAIPPPEWSVLNENAGSWAFSEVEEDSGADQLSAPESAPAAEVRPTPVPTPVAPILPPAHEAEHAGGDYWEIVARYFPEQPHKAYRVFMCESGGDPHIRTNPTYRGAWQFDLTTYRSVGGSGDPADDSMEEQTMRARMLYEARGWQPWPFCGRL